MKTLIFLLLMSITYISCTKEPIEPINQENLYLTLNYVFPAKSGDITPKGESVYLTFYNKYIEGRILTPRIYYANLFDADNHIGASIYGKWGEEKLFIVPPGKYAIDGVSWPVGYISFGTAITGGVCGDTAYLAFHDTIEVTQTSTNFVLNAEYDCSLVLLDTTEVKETFLFVPDTTNWSFPMPYYKAVKTTMMKTEEFYHTFLFNGAINGEGYDKVNLYLGVTTTRREMIYPPLEPSYLENISFSIPLWVYQMQAGKYYYFEHTANGYILPPMTGGK